MNNSIHLDTLAMYYLKDKKTSSSSPPLSSTSYLLILLLFHPMQAHFILDEMVSNGFIVETSKAAILAPVELLDKAT